MSLDVEHAVAKVDIDIFVGIDVGQDRSDHQVRTVPVLLYSEPTPVPIGGGKRATDADWPLRMFT